MVFALFLSVLEYYEEQIKSLFNQRQMAGVSQTILGTNISTPTAGVYASVLAALVVTVTGIFFGQLFSGAVFSFISGISAGPVGLLMAWALFRRSIRFSVFLFMRRIIYQVGTR